MALNYDYDETNETWPFFLLTVLLMIVVPLTISQFYKIFLQKDTDESQKEEEKKNVLSALNDKYTSDDIKEFRDHFETKKNSNIFSWKNLIIIIGWISIAILVQRISSNDAIIDAAKGIFDPYEILGISGSSSEREIKSAYRKLSVKFHPDKVPKDLSEAEKNMMEETFVQITKAYEALTDEAVRENFLKYGHPDGPQSTSHGIALPSFLIDSTSSLVLVIFYISAFVLLLPYFVSKWWNKTKLYTRNNLHIKTAGSFVSRLVNYKPSQIATVDLIINWLSYAEEFKLFYPELTPQDFETLLQDHIHNRDSKINGKDANMMKYRIVAKCHTLLHGFLEVCCGFRNLEMAIVCTDTFKCIVQGIPMSKDSQILQLPNVDEETLKNGSIDEIHTLGKLFTFEDEKIGKILGIKDEAKLKETLTVASNIPQFKLLKAEFVVPGEEYVTPSSTPYISIKVLMRSAKQRAIPTDKIPAEMLKESDDFEDLKNPFASMEKEPIMPTSFAPKFPTKRRNTWCCLIALQKDIKILQTPYKLERLSLSNLSKDLDKRVVKELGPDFNPEDWEIGFIKLPLGQQAPAELGSIYMRVVIKSTDYFGADMDLTMMMEVREPPKIDELKDDIYNDEDSDENSSDDEDLEDDSEDDSDYTDIDTDTEVEDLEEEEEEETK
ncbi:similar to Saccharomyces cerevisiae YOR254C SEC63 Essential subunit of Sec63 complex (Sec63p, Sec62p, Sec66p and Sec72p) [Maudiozyma barnettii]|uniref:Similar to Saccharomyces cerevisiae YOR254C SEC63 Essential subunit of Sec63 complex (Sec63p, Sec62p, Sec66p and Sec72p) n=1 Tax=Maudiozyma barnettii TaxID=61262 RepID=A0A8H2VCF4_9SACH|nr:protein-transporting protein SEC63 [Kazachstania barnettii]CAB4252704.1 similar to Saccharomyces cerevisiae YOR254C SEC63 Essential subunit of Sec63 complex (Sec63p, Sec62p, Sec66p and Sec72p) [Kazachstania barnettii]CAD1780494.1 similar to Saccharomyces cerevisiae YOR254C SEC63 Essential subunit of Sec63 complex (Sec63p, Sec62p, Sec66p and Sec72p) [Kazachstania barnettii]